MDRMPGRYGREFCTVCRRPSGPDCIYKAKSKKQIRLDLGKQLRREVDALRLRRHASQ